MHGPMNVKSTIITSYSFLIIVPTLHSYTRVDRGFKMHRFLQESKVMRRNSTKLSELLRTNA